MEKVTEKWSLFTIKLNRAMHSGNEQQAAQALLLLENEHLNPLQQKIVQLTEKVIEKKKFSFSLEYRGAVSQNLKKLQKQPAFNIISFDVPAPKFDSQKIGNFK